MPIFKESWKMATTIVRRSSVSLSSGSKMSFLQLHSHPYALYLRRSHIPICVDNLTSYRPKNFLRLLFELLSVNKEFEEVTSNTCFICCFFWLWLGKKRLLLLLSLAKCFSFVKLFPSNLSADQTDCLVLPAIRFWNSKTKRGFQKWTISKCVVSDFWRFLKTFGEKEVLY